MLKGAVFFTVAGAALAAASVTVSARTIGADRSVTLCLAGVEATLNDANAAVRLGVNETLACGCDERCRAITVQLGERAANSAIRRLSF